ncbi:uncharacterized protein BCR38DRAFT_452094, partial [Pseudomassariella vexata]
MVTCYISYSTYCYQRSFPTSQLPHFSYCSRRTACVIYFPGRLSGALTFWGGVAFSLHAEEKAGYRFIHRHRQMLSTSRAARSSLPIVSPPCQSIDSVGETCEELRRFELKVEHTDPALRLLPRLGGKNGRYKLAEACFSPFTSRVVM